MATSMSAAIVARMAHTYARTSVRHKINCSMTTTVLMGIAIPIQENAALAGRLRKGVTTLILNLDESTVPID